MLKIEGILKEYNIKEIDEIDPDIFNYAYIKHKGQYRKGGSPAISHPLKVVKELLNKSIVNEAILNAALYHDLLEDTDAREGEIIKIAGDDVLYLVKLLTKDRKTSTKKYIRAIKEDDRAINIKLADRLSNLKDSLDSGDKSFMERYLEHSKRYYLPLSKGTIFEDDYISIIKEIECNLRK